MSRESAHFGVIREYMSLHPDFDEDIDICYSNMTESQKSDALRIYKAYRKFNSKSNVIKLICHNNSQKTNTADRNAVIGRFLRLQAA